VTDLCTDWYNIKKILHFVHTVHLCVLCGSRDKQRELNGFYVRDGGSAVRTEP